MTYMLIHTKFLILRFTSNLYSSNIEKTYIKIATLDSFNLTFVIFTVYLLNTINIESST